MAATIPFLSSDSTCSNDVVGVQSKDICCAAECGTCGGSGCSSRVPNLGGSGCCEGAIRDSGILCSDSGTSPCIIGVWRAAQKRGVILESHRIPHLARCAVPPLFSVDNRPENVFYRGVVLTLYHVKPKRVIGLP